MFIIKLKKIYKESENTSFAYFCQFGEEAQKIILSELLHEKKIDKNLIKYLVDNITNIKILDYIHKLLMTDTEKAKEFKFYKEILSILENKLKFVGNEIGKKNIKIKFSNKIKKNAQELIYALNQWIPELGNEDIFRNAFLKFKKLNKKTKIEIFQYLALEYAPKSKSNVHDIAFLIDEYIKINDLEALDNNAVQEAIEMLFEILSKFDQKYPKIKNFRDYSIAETFTYTIMFGYLINNISLFIIKLIVQLVKESRIEQTIDLISKIKLRLNKFEFIDKEKINCERSIFLWYLTSLITAPVIVNNELAIDYEKSQLYFRNLYILLEKSVENIKQEFKELNKSKEKQKAIINNWKYGLFDWQDKYIDQLKKRNLINEIQIKELNYNFKKEIIKKFES